jgi:hypothetical protein
VAGASVASCGEKQPSGCVFGVMANVHDVLGLRATQTERIGSSLLASSSGRAAEECCRAEHLKAATLRLGNRRPAFFGRADRVIAVHRKTVWTSTHGNQYRIMASKGPSPRRRTEIRRRPPDYLRDFDRPLAPGEFSDNEDFDVDLDYLATGGPNRQPGTARTKETIERQDNWILKNNYTKYLLGGMFVLGIAAGIALDSVVNLEPNNVASREVIDRQTPNPDICLANGMSALVLDQRLFVSFNP